MYLVQHISINRFMIFFSLRKRGRKGVVLDDRTYSTQKGFLCFEFQPKAKQNSSIDSSDAKNRNPLVI